MSSVDGSEKKPPSDETFCPKCTVGKFSKADYVRHAGSGFPRPDCYNCPPEEHLHLTCATCGYTILGQSGVAPPEEPAKA